jgi:hypothetical protein
MDYNFITTRFAQLLDKDEAKLIFEQAEKHLKDQIDTSQLIGTKTTTLLTVVSGLLIGMVGFGISRWSTSGFDSLILTTICGAIYLYVITRKLLENLKPRLYQSIGLHPRAMFKDSLINERNSSYRLKAIYINEIIECQKRIDFNNNTNDKRWERFSLAVRLVSYAPPIFLGLYLIIQFTKYFPIRVHRMFWASRKFLNLGSSFTSSLQIVASMESICPIGSS